MRVGWLIPGVGIFGSVREVVETSNVLARRGHAVTIYHPSGLPVPWLPCLAGTAPLEAARTAELDALILAGQPAPMYLDVLQASPARVKGCCMMGFEPSPNLRDLLQAGESLLAQVLHGEYLILTDSAWQIAWLRDNLGIEAGPAIGGVNVAMFRHVKTKRNPPPYRILWSGDPRPRKGGETVTKALDILRESGLDFEAATYFGAGIPQSGMAEWLSNGDLFLDGHRHGGWCNPVAEAMACGLPVVCTDIPAVGDFALHGETALLVDVGDARAMADAAWCLLKDNPPWRAQLARAGHKRIQAFSYEVVAPRLGAALMERLETCRGGNL